MVTSAVTKTSKKNDLYFYTSSNNVAMHEHDVTADTLCHSHILQGYPRLTHTQLQHCERSPAAALISRAATLAASL